MFDWTRFLSAAVGTLCLLGCTAGASRGHASAPMKVVARTPDAVVPVFIADGIPYENEAGQTKDYQHLVVVRISGVNAPDFFPSAAGGRYFMFEGAAVSSLLSPGSGDGRASFLIPQEAVARSGYLWATPPDVNPGFLGAENADDIAALKVRAEADSPYWYRVTVPARGGRPRHYATVDDLLMDEAPRRFSRAACEERLGKQCGRHPGSEYGPVECEPCPAGEVCTDDHRCVPR